MKDINDIMPKVQNMRWGALMNKAPTSDKLEEMNKIFSPTMVNGILFLKNKIVLQLMEKKLERKIQTSGHRLKNISLFATFISFNSLHCYF